MKRLLWGGALSLIFCLVFVWAKAPSARAASDSQIWFSGISSQVVTDNLPFYDGNIRCNQTTVSSQYVTQAGTNGASLIFGASTKLEPGKSYPNSCLVSTPQGLFATQGLWSPSSSTTEMRPIDAIPQTIQPLPNGFLLRDGSMMGGYYYSVNTDLLKDKGSLSYKSYGSGFAQKRELTWKIDHSLLASYYTYGDGSAIKFDEIGFSRSGEFAIASIARRGIVRINTKTGELTHIAPTTFNNGVGLFMSITNDGRYGVVSKAGSGKMFVYDMLGCSSKYSSGNWSRGDAVVGTGCSSKDLFPELRNTFPTATTVSGLRFMDSSSVLELYVLSPGEGGQTLSQFARLKPAGHMKSSSGYLAMGDSFASGEGDLRGGTWYEPGTDEQGDPSTFAGRNLCHLSRRSYPYLLAMQLGYLVSNTSAPAADSSFRSVACSGAKMHNITGIVGEKQDEGTAVDFAITDNQYRFERNLLLGSWTPGYERQKGYILGRNDDLLERGKFNPEVISLSIGGNDAGFGQKLLACLLPGTCEFASDQNARANVAKELASERDNLVKTYQQVKAAAPEARIYVIGYPQFVQASPETCGKNVALDNAEATFVNFATGYFNEVIKSASKVAGVQYVDVENILANVNLCSGAEQAQMAVNGITAGNDVALSPVDSGLFQYGVCVVRKCVGAESFHPNQNGHQRYFEEIALATQNLTLANPAPVQTTIPAPSDYFGLDAKNFIDSLNGVNATTSQSYAKMRDLVVGATDYRSPTIATNGLLPGSTVRFEVHSEPIVLGDSVVSGSGEVSFSAELPSTLPAGYHELHLYGFDSFGNPVNFYEPIIVGATENDFDGDSILDAQDSCPSVINSGFDIDEDGVDDACDGDAAAPVVPDPPIEEEPPVDEPPIDETPDDTTPPDEEPQENSESSVDTDKGQVSRETAAGNESVPVTQGVLGASTAAQASSTPQTLATTGQPALLASLLGLVLASSSVTLLMLSRKQKYSDLLHTRD